MFEVDMAAVKSYIDKSGLKQKVVAHKSGISEVRFSLILQSKRRCEAGEYASICAALDVNPNMFLRKVPMSTFVKEGG